MNTIALIQASMNHAVLPCGPMLSLHGLPVINWVIHRLSKAELVDRIAVVTSGHPMDDVLAWHLENLAVEVFRSPVGRVFEGFYTAAHQTDAEHILRVDGRNPLVWGPEVDTLIRFFRKESCDLAYNHDPLGNLYPRGIGAEIISMDFLERLRDAAILAEQGEGWFWTVLDHGDSYRIKTCDPGDARLRQPEKSLHMDTPQAYRRLSLMAIHPDMHPAEALLRFPRE